MLNQKYIEGITRLQEDIDICSSGKNSISRVSAATRTKPISLSYRRVMFYLLCRHFECS